MNSVAERVPENRNRSERHSICSHCGWYEHASKVHEANSPGNDGEGTAKSTAKYRIVM